MGLDMYLNKRTYVQNWDHQAPEHRHEITIKKGGALRTDIKPERITDIVEQVAYWRKANAIHQWFVKHVQDGKDDCRPYYVSSQQLQELKEACDKVLAVIKTKKAKVKRGKVSTGGGPWEDILEDGETIVDPQIAETILPTADGFFFGGTDYDDGYVKDLKYTSAMLAEVLAEPGDDSFEYHASW